MPVSATRCVQQRFHVGVGPEPEVPRLSRNPEYILSVPQRTCGMQPECKNGMRAIPGDFVDLAPAMADAARRKPLKVRVDEYDRSGP